jgi:serine/threonine-protein kinase HipA
VNPGLAGLVNNEFFCMRLARNIGLPVAPVKLVHVPEPVLEVERFDREKLTERVRRLHIIDGCQALGLSAGFKYERPYGDGPDVQAIRDGASLAQVFEFLEKSQQPAAQRLQMLRWVIFQVLIGNTDAHAKNISFFTNEGGFWLTPAYDLVSTLAFDNAKLEDSFAMAVGDAFLESELNPYEWANFAAGCKLRPRLVSVEIKKLVDRILGQLELTVKETRNDGADPDVIGNVCDVIHRMCGRHQAIGPEVLKVDPACFG